MGSIYGYPHNLRGTGGSPVHPDEAGLFPVSPRLCSDGQASRLFHVKAFRRLLPWELASALQLSEPDTCRGRSENVPAGPQLARATRGLPNRTSFPGRSPHSGNRLPAPRLSWRRESSSACQQLPPARDASRRHPARGRAKIWNPKSGRFRPRYSAGLRKASQRQPPAATHGKTDDWRQAHFQHRKATIE